MEYREREEYWQRYKANGQKATVQIVGDETDRTQCKLWLLTSSLIISLVSLQPAEKTQRKPRTKLA